MRWLSVILSLALSIGMNAQAVTFDAEALRLPAMLEGDTAAHRVTFRFRNNAPTQLAIAKVWPTCGCVKVLRQPQAPVQPGARDSIIVQYKSDRNPGTIDEPVFVYAEGDDLNPIAKLHVLGEVKDNPAAQWRHLPASMGPLRLKRKELTFSADDVALRIPCANTSPATLRLRALMLPPCVSFATDPAEIPPGGEADIVVRIDRKKLPATRPVKAAITIDGVPCSLKDRRINITIK